MCFVNNRFGGLSIQDLYNQQHKDLELDYGVIDRSVGELTKKDLLKPEKKHGWSEEVHFYKITEKGKKELNRLKASGVEFYKVLSLLPPYYELRYRLYNIEHLFFHAFFTLLFFKFTLFSLSYNYIWAGFIFAFLTFCFFPFASFYLIEVLIFVFNQEQRFPQVWV